MAIAAVGERRLTYSEKLRSPRWQRRRLEIMERAGFRCERCGAGDRTLNVHHGAYEKGLEPWEYPDELLWCLCEEQCHPIVQQQLLVLQRAFGSVHPKDLEFVMGLVSDAIRGLKR